MHSDVPSSSLADVYDAQPVSTEQFGEDSVPSASSAAVPAESESTGPVTPSPINQISPASLSAQTRSPPSNDHGGMLASNNSDSIQPCDTSKERVCVEENAKDNDNWRASGFANKHNLTRWFPKIEEDGHESWRIWMSKRSQALLLHTTTVAAILITNFTLTLFALVQYAHPNGVGIIYQGSCSTAKQLDRWLHLLINLLGTGMLMASNYCMQLQAAPTRANINQAHGNGKWLDIGVPSLRNLTSIGPWRQLSWFLLASSSLPLHLIYNSAVFTSLASSDHTVAVVNSHFLNSTSSSWNLIAAASRGLGDPGWSWVTEGHPVHLATLSSSPRMTLVPPNSNSQIPSIVPNSDGWAKNQWAIENGTQSSTRPRARPPSSPIATWYLGPGFYEVDSCYVQPPATTEDRCSFEYSSQIMITVCVLNFLKTCTMLVVWWMRKYQWAARPDPEKNVLYTLGDAIQSFIRVPETKTAGMCLATKENFLRRRTRETRWTKPELKLSNRPREWQERKRFWAAAASPRRWTILISICIIILAIAAGLLALSLKSLSARGFPSSVPSWWSLGFGALTPFTYLNIGLPKTDPAGIISNILIANLPQLILSILYLFYNTMLSCFLVQKEFSEMWRKQKPLRVSEPEGIQRSSYFISLPLRYGIPLYVSSGIMHSLISQSLFLARITAYFPDGSVDYGSSFSTCGYSPIALFITILVGIALVVAVVLLDFRQYEGFMPLVATNSFAISAACHALKEDIDGDGYQLPMKWGVVSDHNGIGHCTFSTAYDSKTPVAGHFYA
ncbi:hypothetical protein DL98DRAFT_602140 [Cadophora sp. DSE1049]|nr:hypothetical protein DL98DRAFT_602140 [Cadophora sp. DSE1049]